MEIKLYKHSSDHGTFSEGRSEKFVDGTRYLLLLHASDVNSTFISCAIEKDRQTIMFCGLYYKHVMILNDDSIVVSI